MRKISLSIMALAAITIVFSWSCTPGKTEASKETAGPGTNKLHKLDWLVGKWENKSPEGYAAEIWKKQNDSTYSGVSYFVVGKDTVSYEKISLVRAGNDVFYVPVVKGQNNGLGVRFKMTSQTNDTLVFENPGHDFPQKITYNRVTNDSLFAEISGMSEGKPSSQQFPLVRAR